MAINKSIVPHAYKCTRCSIEDKRVVTSQKGCVVIQQHAFEIWGASCLLFYLAFFRRFRAKNILLLLLPLLLVSWCKYLSTVG